MIEIAVKLGVKDTKEGNGLIAFALVKQPKKQLVKLHRRASVRLTAKYHIRT